MYKKFYQRFLSAQQGIQHYAAHSHHYWPDVTREATIRYWDDSAKYVDDKWDYFFSTEIPETQKLIGQILNLSDPAQIAFAPNTHEFVFRILSCLDSKKKINVLTTDSEFHSFDRQINRLSEDSNFKIEKMATAPFDTFENRMINKIENNSYNLIFFSHVFFNSGFKVRSLEKIVAAVKDKDTIIVIDGYHGFMAVPTDLSSIADRVFYLAGSYKYAQGGEGCCFLHVPKSSALRPVYTGWFAGFSELSEKTEKVTYSDDGLRFAGSTMDYSGLYRLRSVLELFKENNISVPEIHSYIQDKQIKFLKHLSQLNLSFLCEQNLVQKDFLALGHFLAFEMKSPDQAKQVHDFLSKNKIKTDYRGTRLRFGFGLYQDEQMDLTILKSFNMF